ncbi:MAG: metalloregulator ArsR/SmtB family transcription factor [Actinobacteria bacterium]|nr:metalloregulator ArsR/SmtB family transcription factor [Actinomycetota bacterium]
MKEYVETFKSLGDETRLRILYLLINANSELCCCELTDSLEEPQYNISRHLRILKNAGLIEERREGRWIYSFISKEPSQFNEMLIETVRAIPETKGLKKDLENLSKRLNMREDSKCVLGIQKPHLLKRGK